MHYVYQISQTTFKMNQPQLIGDIFFYYNPNLCKSGVFNENMTKNVKSVNLTIFLSL